MLFEAGMFFAGFSLDVTIFQAVFMLSLVLGPLIIFPWVLLSNVRQTDEDFESPLLWTSLAALGFLASIAMIAVGTYALIQGSVSDFAYLAFWGVVAALGSRVALRSARKRKRSWQLMKTARRMACPICGIRVSDSVGICRRCGAIVFWVPTWLG